MLRAFGDLLFDEKAILWMGRGVRPYFVVSKPTAREEQMARERTTEEERDDPIEQAIIHLIRCGGRAGISPGLLLAAVARGGAYTFGGGEGSRTGSGLSLARIARKVWMRHENG